MRVGGICIALLLTWWGATPAAADGPLLSVSLSGGATGLDRGLDDYRWDLGPHAQWGTTLRAHRGRWSGGLRVTRLTTTQATGIPGDSRAPAVRLTTVALIGEAKVVELIGIDLLATAQVGRLHLGYDPDRLEIDVGGGPLEVKYDAVDEWTGGVGIGLRRTLIRGLELGLAAERSFFRLLTSHRNGDEIETGRDTFGHWTMRLELGFRFGP